MDKSKYFNEQDALSDDLDFTSDSVESAVENRSKDVFGIGGFISGGIVSTNGMDPDRIDITSGIVYDSRGRRITFTVQTSVGLIDLTGADNYVLVSIPRIEDTPVFNPINGVVENTRIKDTFNIEIRLSFTPGDNDVDGNPFVPIAKVMKNQPIGPLIITDLRRIITDLAPNSVNTEQIVDNAVISAKLADYLKPIVWTTTPDLYYDKDTRKLNSRRVGNFNLEGFTGNIPVSAGAPITLPFPVGEAQIIIGTITEGPNLCTLSAIALTTFADFSTVEKQNIIVLGYVNINGAFTNLQADTNDELMLLSEEEFSASGLRIKANENMWRRGNEAFQSFTSNSTDGVLAAQPNIFHQLGINAGNLTVEAGISYVSGRRIVTPNQITLSVLNTKDYAIMVGTASFDIYMLRIQDTAQFRFLTQGTGTPAPATGYLLGQVSVVGGVFTTVIDKRVFTPIPQIPSLLSASQTVRIGAKLKNMTAPADIGSKIMIEPGVVGFADGSVRQNTSAKILDFSTPYNASIPSVSIPTVAGTPFGGLQTQQGGSPTGLEPFSHYAIFAVADHIGTDFNVVAVKVPFFRNVTGANIGGGQYQYTLNSPGNFPVNRQVYLGQKIRATRTDYTPPQFSGGPVQQNPALTESTQDNSNPETIVSVVGNVVTTQIGSTTPLGGFAAGTFTIMNKLRPNSILSGISNRYRLLGFVSTEGTAVPNTVLRKFQADGDNVLFGSNGNVNEESGKIGTAGATSQSWRLDFANFIPVIVQSMKFKGRFGINQGGAFQDAVRAYVGPGDGTGQTFVYGFSKNPTWSTPNLNTATWTFSSGEGFSGQVKSTMGFVFLSVSSGISWPFTDLGFSCVGYTFNVGDEWGLQLSGGGFTS